MKLKRIPIFFVLWAAAIFAAAGNSPVVRVRLEEMLAIGGPDNDLLFLWTSVSADPAGNLYVADAMDDSIKKFGPDGGFLKKAGRTGKGPGEFEKALGVAVAGNFVYAWDLYSRALQVFDRDLVYQRSLPMPGNVDGLGVLPDGRLAVSLRAMFGPPKVGVFSPEGKMVREFLLADSKEKDYVGSVSVVIDPLGEFYCGFLFRDLLEKRNVRGERIWVRTPLGAKSIVAQDINGLKIPSETCLLSIGRDGKGRVYVLGGDKAVHRGRDVFVFDPNGSAVASFILPEPSHSLYFDNADHLYVSADSGVTLKKYRVIFE